MDEETGLYYYGARYYDAKTSVWQSVDEMAEKYPSVSPYAYCFNNPVIFVDPDGRDIILSALFTKGAYGKVFNSLKANSKTFKGLIAKYENNSKFNLKLTVNDKKVNQAGAGALTEYAKAQFKVAPNSLDVTSYFKSNISVTADYEYTDLGVVLAVAHEAIHQKIALLPVKESDSHDSYNNYISDLINVFTEYSEANNLNLSKNDIKDLSFSGQQGSKQFKKYITDLAKGNNTTYDKEKNSYDIRVSNLIYKKKDEKK